MKDEYMETERYQKLPAHARDRIATLTRDLAALEETVRTMAGAPETGEPDETTGRVCLQRMVSGEDLSIPDHTAVRYQVVENTNRHWGGHIIVRLIGDRVELHGASQLLVTPRVTNVVEVSLANARGVTVDPDKGQ